MQKIPKNYGAFCSNKVEQITTLLGDHKKKEEILALVDVLVQKIYAVYESHKRIMKETKKIIEANRIV